MSVSYHTNSRGIKLAYVHSRASGAGEILPAVVFLGGFKSDMCGSKALYLEERCRKLGQEYLRFDYSGHGQSEGNFVDGTIGGWLDDAREVITHTIQVPQVILVGSSMGGWLALRLLLDLPQEEIQIKGVIGVAAAPDFTKDIEKHITSEQHAELEENGQIEEPNEYGDDPYIFTRALLDDGRKQSLLDPAEPYKINAVLTLLQGKQDNAVHWKKALQIRDAFERSQVNVIFVDDGDHSLSRLEDLILLDKQISCMF
ncbi:MAG: alpha/beta hydrolase [Alphaproteobacteria bacterium]|nr:alpha/beta hydrolase [Alphaproteobacteria bacterium]